MFPTFRGLTFVGVSMAACGDRKVGVVPSGECLCLTTAAHFQAEKVCLTVAVLKGLINR